MIEFTIPGDAPSTPNLREHLCGETDTCADCEAWCCSRCSEEAQSGTALVRLCNRCADAEEADREEMP